MADNPETLRLKEDDQRLLNWKRWGPYLSERQWGTVREDYSANGDCWNYFPHDHARSRAYRWGEDGLLGICDRECRLCFALALWNGEDPILKERIFGLTGPQGNHGEDAKEAWFYLDATPTNSYLKGLYKYPQAAFPYTQLVDENQRRTRQQTEFELADTGIWNESRYFDVVAEYAKNSPNDILIRITITNRGPEKKPIHLLPTIWFKNNWSWGDTSDDTDSAKPTLQADGSNALKLNHATLGHWRLEIDADDADLLVTENETNAERIFNSPSESAFTKDAFHNYVVQGKKESVNPQRVGTKGAALLKRDLEPGASFSVRLRMFAESEAPVKSFDDHFNATLQKRIDEADEFYRSILPTALDDAQRLIARQCYAGLLWSRQFYHYVVMNWLVGDPSQPTPPAERMVGRNSQWTHLFSRDLISMPDKWEYPWFAAWDLAFHMIPLSRVDPENAKAQLILFLREWYMDPSGQLPAYEFAFGDVNPPVHAWACWRVYKMTGPKGKRDRDFLERSFQKLLINFTWWVNRKDIEGKQIFGGGFLGLDNIGLFDRSKPLPEGQILEQADGTAWMAFYCGTMLSMALELASEDGVYEDVASKFFEHFIAITDAINTLGGTGLWDDQDGFYYDLLQVDGRKEPMRIRSLVGLVPLMAVEVLSKDVIAKLPGFCKRMNWFMTNRKDLSRFISYMEGSNEGRPGVYLLAIPSKEKLLRVLQYMLDESEFLSPYGLRSVSRIHAEHPFKLVIDGQPLEVHYTPGESDSNLFGGNSNWRGPVWFPLNFLLIEALERYHYFYGERIKVECPTGSGRWMNLQQVAQELAERLTRLFTSDSNGRRPCFGDDPRFATDPNWRDLVLFNEYFHGDSGRGLGASHQTGWTSLVLRCQEILAKHPMK